jgi:hypothetical protein
LKSQSSRDAIDCTLPKQAATASVFSMNGHYVDWEMVEALGSVKKYQKEKEQQHKLYGLSEAGKAAIEAAEKKALELAAAEKKKQEEHAKNWFQVMAGLEAKKVQLARAA